MVVTNKVKVIKMNTPIKVLVPKEDGEKIRPMKVFAPKTKMPILNAQDYSSQEMWMAKSFVLSYVDSRKAIPDGNGGLLCVDNSYNHKIAEYINAYKGGINELDIEMNKLCGAYAQKDKNATKNHVFNIARIADYIVNTDDHSGINAS